MPMPLMATLMSDVSFSSATRLGARLFPTLLPAASPGSHRARRFAVRRARTRLDLSIAWSGAAVCMTSSVGSTRRWNGTFLGHGRRVRFGREQQLCVVEVHDDIGHGG